MEITVQQPRFSYEDRIILDLYFDKKKLFSEEGFSSRIANTIGARRESPIFLRHRQEKTREKQNFSEKNQKNLIAYCAGL
ncbi:MAG: hypothetical protein ACFNJL_04665 [Selenomonas sp.]|jgi:putative 50S ribosomal protein L32e|uniref:hypothetical protein n=1 Tax=uncultured Selenomonas sp. TaxID=159275 RepID=UPI0028E4E382|nr:hypothetical protein [uncultured Selenomonas sp.]